MFLQVLGSRARGVLAVGTAAPLDAADLSIVNTAASLLTLALAQNGDATAKELRTCQFRLLLAGQPVDGLPERFRVFLTGTPPEDGFWAEHEGQIIVLAKEFDGFASSEVDVTEVARCFTGWTIAGLRQGRPQFTFQPRLHDRGDKVVLGHRIKGGGQDEGPE